MKLLAYSHIHNLREGTGTGRFASEVLRGLAVNGSDCVSVVGEGAEIARQAFARDEAWSRISFLGFDRSFRQQQLAWLALGRPLIDSFQPEADLVYSPAEAFVATRKPFAVTIHDAAYFDDGAHAPGLSTATQRLKWQWLFSRLAQRADLIHTVSTFSAERLSYHFPQMKGRIGIVPNGVSEFFFNHKEKQVRGRYIHVPGGLLFRKNADLILEAWRLFCERDTQTLLVVTGNSNPKYLAKFAQFEGRVKLLGYVDDAQLRRIYQGASAVWFPSRYEGFGIPVLEAMASGTPVLTSTSSALPEVAGDAALLQSWNDPVAHARSLRDLIEDNQLAQQLAALGRERAKLFRWHGTVQQLRSHFEKLVS